MKKTPLIPSILVFFLIFSFFTSHENSEAKSPFSDVNGHWAQSEIQYLSSQGIVSGYPDGSFGANLPIKRSEIAAIIARELALADEPPAFTDVLPSHWAYSSIGAVSKAGIITGYPDGTFKPNAPLTRQELAAILVRAYALSGKAPVWFRDIEASLWSYESIQLLVANRITSGYADFTFKPNNKLTRAELAVFMSRTLEDSFKTKPDLHAHFIDVGQGDSTLIQTPNGKTILIDGGLQSAGDKVVSYLKKAGISSVDLLVSTHPDADHIGGLLQVLQEFDVKKIIDSGKTHTTQTYFDYLSLIDQKNIPFEVPTMGQFIEIDSALSIQILNSTNESNDLNESSIVIKVSYDNIDFLFTGDATTDNESTMMKSYQLEAEILKVGHHGSNTSTSQLFLDTVSPKMAVFSYGENNRYDHPHHDVISRLLPLNVQLFSTAISGDIIIKTNGDNFFASSPPWDGKKTQKIPDDNQPVSPYPVNINTADYETLQKITGVGEVIAERIIHYRNTYGPFHSIDDIKHVKGIGNVTFEKMKSQLTI